MAHPNITHPKFADDASAGGTFRGIRQHLDNLMVRGPPHGYFLDLTKSILVVSTHNFPRAEAFFRGYGLHIVTGSCLLGGFHGVKGGAGSLAGGESGRLVGFSGHLGRGGFSAPTDRIHDTVEVPPAGVGLCETIETTTGEARAAASNLDAHRLGQMKRAGAWMSVLSSTVNGTTIGAQEWRDSLCLSYGIEPLDLPSYCSGCGAAFPICHALDYKKGGLITARHNERCDGVTNLPGKSRV